VACGTTGAPRNVQAPVAGAQAPPATRTQTPPATGTRSRRLIGFVTGRRTKYLVVASWLLLVAVALSPAIFRGIDSALLHTALLYPTLAIVIVLLILACRSPVLWLLPVASAGVALAAAEAVIYLLTQHASLTVNGDSKGILVILVIGTCTDYALLLIARYREELRRHADHHVAMAVALRRAGPAIIASGLTVVAGIVCLLAVKPNDISGLGPVAAVGIAGGLIAMVTLLPALLTVFGRRIFWPVRPGLGTTHPMSSEPMSSEPWSVAGKPFAMHPRRVWTTAVRAWITTASKTTAVLLRISGGPSGGQAH
jgi:putative drug exporter of the RND superfamily